MNLVYTYLRTSVSPVKCIKNILLIVRGLLGRWKEVASPQLNCIGRTWKCYMPQNHPVRSHDGWGLWGTSLDKEFFQVYIEQLLYLHEAPGFCFYHLNKVLFGVNVIKSTQQTPNKVGLFHFSYLLLN